MGQSGNRAIGDRAWDMAKLAVAGITLHYITLLYINFKYWPVAITYLKM
jgi:hypothetical protein